jgi:hypothetical protein
VLDVLSVPDRLKEAVGETEGEDVLSASLPRKWSMRKICFSEKTPCTVALSCTALKRSMPNGFSMTMRAFSASPASARRPTTAGAALGGMLR